MHSAGLCGSTSGLKLPLGEPPPDDDWMFCTFVMVCRRCGTLRRLGLLALGGTGFSSGSSRAGWGGGAGLTWSSAEVSVTVMLLLLLLQLLSNFLRPGNGAGTSPGASLLGSVLSRLPCLPLVPEALEEGAWLPLAPAASRRSSRESRCVCSSGAVALPVPAFRDHWTQRMRRPK